MIKFEVGSGSLVRFSLDWWHGDAPLCSSFPVLFSYCANPEASIWELAAAHWDFGFRRALSPVELANWQELTATFPTLSETPDRLLWPHSPSGKFLIKSLYGKLVQGHRTNRFLGVWRARIPLKIKIFLWQDIRKRLPASDQILKQHGNVSAACSLCGETENT